MNISFKDALTFYFKDEHWKAKLLVLAVILNTAFLFSNIYLGIATIVFVLGYLTRLANNLINKKGLLPGFALVSSDKAITAIFATLVGIIYTVVVGLCTIVIYLICIIPIIFLSFSDVIEKILLCISPILLALILIPPLEYAENLEFTGGLYPIKLIKSFTYAFKEYMVLTLIWVINIGIAILIKFNNNGFLYLKAILLFIAISMLLYYIITLLFKKKSWFSIEFPLFILFIFAQFILVMTRYLPENIFLKVISFTISAPLAISWQHLCCQAYRYSLDQIQDSEIPLDEYSQPIQNDKFSHLTDNNDDLSGAD